MEKIAIISDSSCGITQKEANQLNIQVIPMPIIIDGKEEFDGETISSQELIQLLNQGKNVKTSQISPLVLKKYFKETLKNYDYVIYIPISSLLSGSYETAQAIAVADFPNKVAIIDNKTVAGLQKYEVMLAKKLVEEGKSFKEIVNILQSRACNSFSTIIPSDLSFLKKGGRITPSAALLANLLNIKPILIFKDGFIDKLEKVRSFKKAIKVAIEFVLSQGFEPNSHEIIIHHCFDEELLKEIHEEIKNQYGEIQILKDYIPAIILSHTGPGTVAIGRITKYF